MPDMLRTLWLRARNNWRVLRCLATCRRERTADVSWHLAAGLVDDELRTLIDAPDLPFTGNASGYSVGSGYFLKRSSYSRIADFAKFLVRVSPAQTAFASGIELRRIGFPTPRPVAVGHRRIAGALRRTYLIVENQPGTHTLSESRGDRRRVAAALAAMLVRLEAIGYIHGDISLNNILVDRSGRLHLVDLDTMIYAGKVSPRQSRRQLARFALSAIQHPCVTLALRARFLAEYCRLRDGSGWKIWWRTIASLASAEAARLEQK